MPIALCPGWLGDGAYGLAACAHHPDPARAGESKQRSVRRPSLHPRVNNTRIGYAIAGRVQIKVAAKERVTTLVSRALDIYAEVNGPDRSPCSPLFQGRYLSPVASGLKGHPGGSECGTRAGDVASCSRWAGPYVAALVCDERTLEESIKRGRLTSRGFAELAITRKEGRRLHAVANAPGVSQAVGQLLRPGDVVTVTGNLPGSAFLLVRAKSRKGFSEKRFSDLALDFGGERTVTVERGAFRPNWRTASAAAAPPRKLRADTIRKVTIDRRARAVRITVRRERQTSAHCLHIR